MYSNNGYLLYTLLEIYNWLLFGILPYLAFQSMDYSRNADWWYPGSDVSAHCKLSRCLSFLQGILVGTCTWTVQQRILPHQDSGIFLKNKYKSVSCYQITEYSYNYGQGKNHSKPHWKEATWTRPILILHDLPRKGKEVYFLLRQSHTDLIYHLGRGGISMLAQKTINIEETTLLQ